ncbi:CxxC-x17-CxxC domain-containing protein [Desulfotomaculum arcticum]|uniref:CxxC-x17-CxxC domain-containing protein n=1 Tax=Desulfotruncus arcticus DSM 17038 TaxID=1121424 RepID=A0A1I2YUE1_9FIRM|nr:zinc-ribbon domain containing protein [Desulfotruncus arcticus]SFH29252.1 CxxC-x17-CxxC domain-containing protein [Desulfotomaculum arcticum] [Desulfotruncus arcticus DSM 17038]
MFQDRTLTCRDCGVDFVFSASEQEFFAEKGFTNDPSRCPQCRAARKANRQGGFGGGGNYRQQRQMFPAVCSNCGKETEVPFKPSGDKPVYCRECFRR